MRSKAGNSVLNLVNPPIDNMVLLRGVFDDVVIGSHVPNVGFFTNITVTSLASPLIGAPGGRLSPVFLGTGLEIVVVNNQNFLTLTLSPRATLTGVQATSTVGSFSIHASSNSASPISGQAISALGTLGS